MTLDAQLRREIIRYTASCPLATFDVPQLRQIMARRGLSVSETEVEEAIVFLGGLKLLAVKYGPLGGGRVATITSEGILFNLQEP
jgi:hypothetical protein